MVSAEEQIAFISNQRFKPNAVKLIGEIKSVLQNK